MIDIIVDESAKRIDKKVFRISICCVETIGDNYKINLDLIEQMVKDDGVRFPKNNKKLHFSELNDAQQSAIVEQISKLPLTAKIYNFYSICENEAIAKRSAMLQTLTHLKWLHRKRDINISVEFAEEYKRTAVNQYMKKLWFPFIIPDAILSVFVAHLNEINTKSTSSNVQFYKLLKSKIRLQIFRMEPHEELCCRENRV